MAQVGAAWVKTNEETGKTTIQPKFDEALLPLTITAEKRLILKSNEKKVKPEQPDFFIDMYIPKPKETEYTPF